MAKAIGTLGNIDSITCGGRVFTDLTNLITVQGYVTTGGNINCTPRVTGTTSGYTPSGAKKFRIKAIQHSSGTATTSVLIVGYADNDVGQASATGFTNFKDGINTSAGGNIAQEPAVQVSGGFQYAVDILVPNTKFVAISSNASSGYFILYGYEET